MKTGWIFLLDLLLDGVMVTLALQLGGLKASVWKIGLAALAGAAAARLCAGLPKGMRAALWLPIAAGMMRIAAGRAEKPLRAAELLLAAAGLLERRPVPGDRRKTQLVCTEAAADIIRRGRELQGRFAEALLTGLDRESLETFHRCLAAIDGNIDNIRRNGV